MNEVQAKAAEAAEFRKLVGDMRKAQKAYLRARYNEKADRLRVAKQLEAKVDEALKPVDEFKQSSFFDFGDLGEI